MIYPTRRAIAVMAAGGFLGLIVGVVAPTLWMVAASWVAVILGLTLVDAVLGAAPRDVDLALAAPSTIGMAGDAELTVGVSFRRSPPLSAHLAL